MADHIRARILTPDGQEIDLQTLIESIISNQTDGGQIVKGNVTSAQINNQPLPTNAIAGYSVIAGAAGNNAGIISAVLQNVDGLSGAAVYSLVVQGRIYLFNGSTWDRMRGDITNGLDVDVTRVPAASFPVDTISGAREVIEHGHDEIHDGTMFDVCDTAAIGAGTNRDYLITTPNTAIRLHHVHEVKADGSLTLNFYEDTTTSAAGTALTAYNRNRTSATAATGAVTHTPTVTGVGTLLCADFLNASFKGGGEARESNEWILKQNAKYLLRLTNGTAGTVNSYIKLNWYEV